MDLKHFLQVKLQKPYTREKIISIIASGVFYLAKMHSIPNEEKKVLLLNTIKEIINETDLDDYSKENLINLIDTIGSEVIEQLITFGKDATAFIKNKCFKKCC
jgi:hypothetical protein